MAVLQPRVHVVRRLAAQLREPGRLQRLLAGPALGQRLELEERRRRPEHPGRQQPDPRRRRVVGGRLGRLLARPRRLGADRRRRRDHDRGVQLPPRRQVRHPHDLELQLVVAERVHPHQGHPDPQHGVAGVSGYAAGRQEADHHQRHVEREATSRSSYQWLGQRQADRRRDDQVVQAWPPASSASSIRAKVTATKSGAHSGSAKSPADRQSRQGRLREHGRPGGRPAPPQVGVPLRASSGTWTPGRHVQLPVVRRRQADHRRHRARRFTPTADQLGSGLKVKVVPQRGRLQDAAGEVRPDQRRRSPASSVATTPPTHLRRRPGRPAADGRAPARGRPAGAVSYQWLADGTPIARRHRHGVHADARPTCARASRSRSPSSSAGTTTPSRPRSPPRPVAPGTFLNTVAPSIAGTRPGRRAADRRQGHVVAAGRTSPTSGSSTASWCRARPRATFTPRPQDLGKTVTVVVTASRPGYLTSSLPTSRGDDRPAGRHPQPPGARRQRHARSSDTRCAPLDGTWSITPDSARLPVVRRQHPIARRHRRDVPADRGRRRTAGSTSSSPPRHAGYTSSSATSDEHRPGRLRPGRRSTSRPSAARRWSDARSPPTSRASTRRRRRRTSAGTATTEPIRGAHEATYVVQTARPRPPPARRRDDAGRELGAPRPAFGRCHRRPDRTAAARAHVDAARAGLPPAARGGARARPRPAARPA